MLDIGGWEFLVVAFVLIMVVGPKELPKMLRGFTNLTKQMRRMAREFTDGMNQIAADAEVADLKAAMNKAKSGDLDELADAIDPDGTVGDSVRDMKNSVRRERSHPTTSRRSATSPARPATGLPPTQRMTARPKP